MKAITIYELIQKLTKFDGNCKVTIKDNNLYIINPNNIPTFEYLNNCNELRDFMINHFNSPLNSTVCFQGDMVEFDGYAVPKKGEVIPVDSYSANFTVGTVNEVTNTFVLTLGKSTDEAYGVELPAYVREELIATLQDKW